MKANSPEEAMEEIISIYRSQLEKYRLIMTLSKEQLAAAQDKNTVLVDQVLDGRQQLITEIDNLNTGLSDLKAVVMQNPSIKDFNWTEISKVFPETASEFQKVIVQISEILAKTTELDKLNQQILAEGRQAISGEIKRSKTIREVRSAYQDLGTKQQEAKFIDRTE